MRKCRHCGGTIVTRYTSIYLATGNTLNEEVRKCFSCSRLEEHECSEKSDLCKMYSVSLK